MPLTRPLALLAFAAAAAVAPACGSRTMPSWDDWPALPAGACLTSADCASPDLCTIYRCEEGQCVPAALVDCDDGDVCTLDRCVPETGGCVHEPATPDLDGDGHRASLPGQPGVCGDDCDDTNAAAHPGGTEVCDGVDNDCNGIVDDGMGLVPTGEAVRVSEGSTEATPDGLGFSSRDGTYLVSYTEQVDGRDVFYVARLSRDGTRIGDPLAFTHVGQNTYGGPVVWTGDRFGTAWTDRRDTQGEDSNYEIYFNEMGPDGSKLGPDRRVTHSVGFSVGPQIVWTGTDFVTVYQDDGPSGQQYNELFGQRIRLDGTLSGGALALGQKDQDEEAASIAIGTRTIGLAWMQGGAASHRIELAVLGPDLALKKGPIELTGGSRQGVSPSVAYTSAGYAAVYYDPNGKLAIYGAVVDERGTTVVAPRPITATPRHSRFPALLSYGDRVVLVFSDDKDQNEGYELYAELLSTKLDPLTSEMRVTTAPGDSVGPIAAFGPSGDVGVVFRDDREGTPQVYFTRLSCGPLTR